MYWKNVVSRRLLRRKVFDLSDISVASGRSGPYQNLCLNSHEVYTHRFITSFSDMKCCVAVILSVLLARTTAAHSDIVVQTQDGTLRGTTLTSPRSNRTFFAFMGIPYAKPPVQNLRFMVMLSLWSTYTPVRACPSSLARR
jgi:hypothetical protein